MYVVCIEYETMCMCVCVDACVRMYMREHKSKIKSENIYSADVRRCSIKRTKNKYFLYNVSLRKQNYSLSFRLAPRIIFTSVFIFKKS